MTEGSLSKTMKKCRQVKVNHQEVIGIIPAGGKATRIAPLPCSKELYPIGFGRTDKNDSLRPKVVCQYLLEKMRLAGITKTYIILRDGKWDIPAYLGDGEMLNMHLAYLMMRLPFGVPYTIDQAYPFVQDAIVALGFPDVLFQPDEAFVRLLERQTVTNADIVLGLFPTDFPQKWDMVDLDEEGRIHGIIIKSHHTHLRYAWIMAVWTPVFTHFMHKYLSAIQRVKEPDSAGNKSSERQELWVGDVIQSAIQDDMKVDSVLFKDGSCLDIGTPEDMIKAIQNKI
jgi:glucose-1-phosphate thymidylyltransferase